MIDPGHGGSDSGAVNKNGEEEKTFTLVIAKDLGAWLQKQGIETILTRNTDTFIPLTQRTAIANFDHADVFLSIHINASPSPLAKGAETYFMSRQATNLWSKQLAEKENASSGGRSPDGNALSMVLWSLAQNRYMAESSDLAEAIQKRLNDLLGTKERGVSQAPFVVLEGAEMPAVLVEVAFLTNPHEAAQLSDSDFQDQVAATLGKAIMDFRAKHDGKNPALPTP
ncbi:MAG: N-acetylmuramoyl-L-alanine amidase [Acidobacteriota bacterium]